MPASCKKRFFLYIKFVVAWVAQWIEQWFPKPLVAGSIPAPGTKFIAVSRSDLRLFLYNRTRNSTTEYHLELFFRFVTVFSAIEVHTGNRGEKWAEERKT